VRKLNKEKKTNLQLIMTPDSKAYLDRDVEITRIDVSKLTRSAIDILAWNLVKNYQVFILSSSIIFSYQQT
jgi:hypothetical protein